MGAARCLELVSYMTHCKLQRIHQVLTLKLAMTGAYKAGNFITAEGFAKRLLDLPKIGDKLKSNAMKVIKKSQKEGRNALKIKYNPDDLFKVCGSKLVLIERGGNFIGCPQYGQPMKLPP